MDTIGEFLTRIRNAGNAKHEKVDVPASNMRVSIAQILAEQGKIRSFKVAKDSRQGIMRIYLKYDESGHHAITEIERVSTPGRRLYVQSKAIPIVRSGLGFCVLSTSKGLLAGDEAIRQKLGGEFICKVW